MPVLLMSCSSNILRKLPGWETGRPMYSSRWNASTLPQSTPGAAVNASRNSFCDAAVAATIRALPWSSIARRIADAACSAAALPSEVRSSKILKSIFYPYDSGLLGQGRNAKHALNMLEKVTRERHLDPAPLV